MAPPIAASDHFTSGDSRNVGIGSSDPVATGKASFAKAAFSGHRPHLRHRVPAGRNIDK
jgi:hypothetical protein